MNEKQYYDWLNCWGDLHEKPEAIIKNKLTNYGLGYKQAMRDAMKRYNETREER